ncbi:hypothetical protein A2U01_0107263, partial [Trifolium medium]|nr:hypothetical protein [Trifolium medium]
PTGLHTVRQNAAHRAGTCRIVQKTRI